MLDTNDLKKVLSFREHSDQTDYVKISAKTFYEMLDKIDKLTEIQMWAGKPTGIKDVLHRAGYEHAQHDVLMKLI